MDGAADRRACSSGARVVVVRKPPAGIDDAADATRAPSARPTRRATPPSVIALLDPGAARMRRPAGTDDAVGSDDARAKRVGRREDA
jgi:hypothetical protein